MDRQHATETMSGLLYSDPYNRRRKRFTLSLTDYDHVIANWPHDKQLLARQFSRSKRNATHTYESFAAEIPEINDTGV